MAPYWHERGGSVCPAVVWLGENTESRSEEAKFKCVCTTSADRARGRLSLDDDVDTKWKAKEMRGKHRNACGA